MPAPLDRLEHVDGPDDVDRAPERRVGPAERHLERGEVDDVRDPLLVERPLERRQVGDVAGDELDRGELVGGHDLLEPAAVAAEVERDDRRPLADERADRPRADAAERARDEEPLAALTRACSTAAPTAARADAASIRQRFVSRPMPSISTVTTIAVGEEPRRIAEDADAAGRAGRDHVARLERERLRAVADDLGDAEVHLRGVRVLEDLAVDRCSEIASPCGSPISSAVTSAGPIGQNVSSDLPRTHWPSPNWRSRADTSFRQV